MITNRFLIWERRRQPSRFWKNINLYFRNGSAQNFLIDPRVLDRIIAAAEIGADDFVLEIGPGSGR